MRIALVTNGLLYGGAERIVEALAVGLDARGDDVRVIATTRGGPIADALRARGIPVSILGITSAVDARVPVELAGLLRRMQADVVHSHLVVSDLATALARVLAPRVRTVTTVHSAYVELGRGRIAVWRRALRAFDRVTAVSETVRGLLPAGLDVEIVRPSLVDPSDPMLARAEARARLGVPGDAPLVLGVGRLAPVKGFDVLAAALPRLTTRGARVLVIGDGPERAHLEGGVGRRGSGEAELELVGARDDAAELLAAADVVVCPSRSEGFPQVPLHAMAAGVPVVATRVGGTPEVVADGVSGLLVPPEDPRALAAALDRLLQDRALAARLGAGGRTRLETEGLSRSAMVDRTRAIYAALLRAPP